jgi:pyridoxine 4-dehydrogenase
MPVQSFPLAGRDVRRVGFGAMQLGTRAQPDEDAAVALLREVVERGVDHIDTADFYPGVNARIRTALQPYRDDVVIATKIGAVEQGAGLTAAQKPEELRAQVEANLRSLGTERLDLVYLRRADMPPGIVATGDQVVDLDAQLAELVALRDAGVIRAIGLSHVPADQLRQAIPAGIAAVQNAYNLAARHHEDELELAAAHGIAWVPFFPLGSAFGGNPNAPEAFRKLMSVTDLPEVTDAAARLGATPSQVALAWLLQHSPNVLLIPGTRSSEHLAENLAAGGLELPADVVTALDAVAPPAAA